MKITSKDYIIFRVKLWVIVNGCMEPTAVMENVEESLILWILGLAHLQLLEKLSSFSFLQLMMTDGLCKIVMRKKFLCLGSRPKIFVLSGSIASPGIMSCCVFEHLSDLSLCDQIVSSLNFIATLMESLKNFFEAKVAFFFSFVSEFKHSLTLYYS